MPPARPRESRLGGSPELSQCAHQCVGVTAVGLTRQTSLAVEAALRREAESIADHQVHLLRVWKDDDEFDASYSDGGRAAELRNSFASDSCDDIVRLGSTIDCFKDQNAM